MAETTYSSTAKAPPPDEGFHPLSYFIKDSKSDNRVIATMRDLPRFLSDATKTLSDMGFRKFRYFGSGDASLVLETTDNQLIRLSHVDSWSDYGLRPEHPAILQPIVRKYIGGFTLERSERFFSMPLPVHDTFIIEVLPRVTTKGVQQRHAALVEEALEKSGLMVKDMYLERNKQRILDERGKPVYRTSNIGLIEVDGKTVPLLIDPGQLKRIHWPDDKERDHLKPWLHADGMWLQYKFDPRTDPTNVVNKLALEKLEDVLRGPRSLAASLGLKKDARRVSQTVEAIGKDGMYADEVAALHALAYDELDTRKGEGYKQNYSEILRAKREEVRKNPELLRKKVQEMKDNPDGSFRGR